MPAYGQAFCSRAAGREPRVQDLAPRGTGAGASA